MFGFIPSADGGAVTKQLCMYLREHIENGSLVPGLRLPPTRQAAQELRIARNLVIEAYEQLTAEGYLTTRTGAGTYIAEGIRSRPSTSRSASQPARSLSVQTDSRLERVIDFDAGTPDLRQFPRRLWSKYVKEIMNREPDSMLAYSDVRGTRDLREAIARYVYRMKGICCDHDQVVITSGTSEGFLLLAAAFADRCQSVYIEEPTIDFVADIFKKCNYRIHAVEVDQHGMVIGRMPASGPAGLIVLTPSHQYPTGSILSIQRRQQVVGLAEETGHYIVEDDYDGEFRHKGSPIPPLQTLAPERVIYASTFSKTLSPALRLGYLIIPPQLMERIVQTKKELHLTASGMSQSALAHFMEDGHFDRHILKMRAIYKNKRMLLTQRCSQLFGDDAQILGDEAGMHVQIALNPELYGAIDWTQLETFGVRMSTFEDYARQKGKHPGLLVLGYGNLTEEEISEGVSRLYRFLHCSQS